MRKRLDNGDLKPCILGAIKEFKNINSDITITNMRRGNVKRCAELIVLVSNT